ncbi:unnamed protein product [Symbiodinium natans]|uniref:Uncharacterized protein n=1 Tax=Symbiodinium natans TaxID=878477 RepID=A0A812KYD5_9DINO|nr:unnamed protein product [Symbiodinium natans]
MEFPSYLPEFAERDVPRGITQKRRDVDGRNNVRVRANVIEIVEVDTVRETFQAVFVLEFTYVDPTLENTWLHLKYRDDNGSVVTTFAQVLGQAAGDRIVVRTGRQVNDSSEIIQDEAGKAIRKDRVLAIYLPEYLRETDPDGWAQHFALDWSFMNAIDEPKIMMQSRQIEYFSERGAHVKYKGKFNAILSERLELDAMPFDRQLLRIQVVAEIPAYRMRFLPTYSSGGRLKTSPARPYEQVPREWRVDADRRWLPKVEVLEEDGPNARSRFDIHIYLERNPTFYLYNLCLLLAMFTLATCIGFCTDVGGQADRLSVHLTLLLTTVAYKYVVTTWLPVKPYQTRLDKFTLRCFYFQFAAMGLCALEPFLQNRHVISEEGMTSLVICVYSLLFALLLALGCMVTLGEYGYCRALYQWFFFQEWNEVYASNHVWPNRSTGEPPSIYVAGAVAPAAGINVDPYDQTLNEVTELLLSDTDSN